MSLFTVVKQVMAENGWPSAVTQVGSSNDPNMIQAAALANRELEALCSSKTWPKLMREVTLNVVAGQFEYDLPSDFDRFLQPSAVDSSKYLSVKGSLSNLQWFQRLARTIPDWQPAFMLDHVGNKIRLNPVPAASGTFKYVYITNNFAVNGSGAPIRKYAADTDVSAIYEPLVELGLNWRWRQKKGLDFTAEMAEYNAAVNRRFAQEIAAPEIDVGTPYNYGSSGLTNGYVPETGYGS